MPSFIHSTHTDTVFIHYTHTDTSIHSLHPHKHLHSFTTLTQIPPFIHYTHTNTSSHLLHPHKYLYSFTTPTQISSFIHYTHIDTFIHSLHQHKYTTHTHKCHHLFTTPTQIPSFIHNTTKQPYWQAKLPSQVACIVNDVEKLETPHVGTKPRILHHQLPEGEAQKEETLSSIPWNDQKVQLSNRPRSELFRK